MQRGEESSSLRLKHISYLLKKNKSHKVISRHFVHGMVSEVAASLMADRDATRQELEDCRRF